MGAAVAMVAGVPKAFPGSQVKCIPGHSSGEGDGPVPPLPVSCHPPLAVSPPMLTS